MYKYLNGENNLTSIFFSSKHITAASCKILDSFLYLTGSSPATEGDGSAGGQVGGGYDGGRLVVGQLGGGYEGKEGGE